MFGSRLPLVDKYDYHSEKFKLAYEFLRRPELTALAEGSISLGQGVTAHVQHYVTSPARCLKFETHLKYFDVQYVVRGRELISLTDNHELELEAGYDTDRDIIYYKEPEFCGNLLLQEGDLIVVGPEEAHKPRCSVGEPCEVIKIVVKVPV